MRVALAAVLSSVAVIAPGDRAAATFGSGSLRLTLHYLMTCGQPGPGPLAVTLPGAFRIANLRVAVNGKPASVSHHGRTMDVTLTKPPQPTCMSIGEGTLRVTISGLHAPRGTYTATARVNRHSFRPSFRVG